MATHGHPRRTWVLILTSVASLMVALDLLVVTTALSTIRLDINASIAQLQWSVTAYGLSFAVLLMTGAALGDRFGRRRIFTIGLALFAAASAGCALSPDVSWLIAARTVQGAGAALVMPLAVAMLGAAYPDELRGRALGVFEGVTGLATIAGPLVGGMVAHEFGWEWIFWINVPIALCAIVLTQRYVGESHGEDTALDTGGMVLVTGGALGLVWALTRGNVSGWTSSEVLGAFAAGAGMMVLFVRRERRTREPMLPMSLFGSRAFTAAVVASFLLFAALYGSVFFMAQFLQTGLGYTPMEAGLRLVPWTATLFVIAPTAGLLADRFGNRPILTVGLTLKAAGMAWIAALAASGTAYSSLVLPLVLTGIGASMAIPVVQNAVLGAVAPTVVGKASGANNMTQELGGVFGVAILVVVFTAAGGYGTASAFLDGITAALAICAVLAAAGAGAALALPRRARATKPAGTAAGQRSDAGSDCQRPSVTTPTP